MKIEARYVHTNIVAHDWKRLSDFYISVFGCTPVPPQRDLSGPWLERATKVRKARIQGVHLRLPGFGASGPTLEIFQYTPEGERTVKGIYTPGISHIAFSVSDVNDALERVVEKGGSLLGETVNVRITDAGEITFVYAKDPEGNIIELQKWTTDTDRIDT
jgi:predicted enzyme related to lactoylglutathione lyase